MDTVQRERPRFPFSNFETVPGGIRYEGDEFVYPTVEHAYQAMKTNDLAERRRIREAQTPGKAKRLGRTLTARPDWDQVKPQIMQSLLRHKFSQEPFRSRLLSFEGPIVETNTWHDQTWGDCVCGAPACQEPGQNLLGRLLTELRAELRAASAK